MQSNINIFIKDVNNHPPEFHCDPYETSVSEVILHTFRDRRKGDGSRWGIIAGEKDI